MALVVAVMLTRTAHILDRERSTALECDRDGKVIQGGPVAKRVPPWTPFEIDGDEAVRLQERWPHDPTRWPPDEVLIVPAGVADPVAWVQAYAAKSNVVVAVGELVRA